MHVIKCMKKSVNLNLINSENVPMIQSFIKNSVFSDV